jgi:uncharacterized protein YjgD (DUF1641 family)
MKGALWQRNLDHLKPELAKRLGISESHLDFNRLFVGLVQTTLQHDASQGKRTKRAELAVKLKDSIEHAKALRKILGSIPEASAIDQRYFSAFREYAKKGADYIRPAFVRKRNDSNMSTYLMDLQGCDEDRAGVNIMLENLAHALEKQLAEEQKSTLLKKHENAHPYLGSLVALAKTVSMCADAGKVEAKPDATYYKYCVFFLHQIAKVPQTNELGNPADYGAHIKRAVLEFQGLDGLGVNAK